MKKDKGRKRLHEQKVGRRLMGEGGAKRKQKKKNPINQGLRKGSIKGDNLGL